MKNLVLAAVCFLSACVFQYMDDGLAALRYQPVQVAFDVLGYPDNKVQLQGKTVYVWDYATSYRYEAPYSDTTQMTVSAMNFGTAFLSGTTHGYQTQVAPAYCRIKVIVNAYGYIEDAEYRGSAMGCDEYATRLYRYLYPRRGGAIF